MCGIFATLGKMLNERETELVADSLNHRGPDGWGQWHDPSADVSLIHTRLSIVGLANGAQPISNEDNTVVAVVNGEFYGWRRIRKRLESKGHVFRTDTDSEILVHLYEEYGIDCVHHLRGEFAFVVWDANERTMVAARDRFGVKPLVWSRRGERVAFASEAKALFASEFIPPRWDMTSLGHAFTHQYLPTTRTVFEGVFNVRPGSMVVVNRQGTRSVDYFRPEFDPTAPGAKADDVLEALNEAVGLRAEADVPIAAYLSGGLDSTACAAILSQSQSVHAFTVSFEDDEDFDELRFAKIAASALDVDLTPVVLTTPKLLDALFDAAFYAEGFAINAHLPAKYLLSRAVRDAGYKVVLTGEGADELFGGYPHFQQDQGANVLGLDPTLRGIMVSEGNHSLCAHWTDAFGYVPAFVHAKRRNGAIVQKLLKDFQISEPELVSEMHTDIGRDLVALPPADRSAVLWSRWALAGYILNTLGDGTEMANSVEGRPAFLDCAVYDVAVQQTVSQKIQDTNEKVLLKASLGSIVPDCVLSRRKQPFVGPPVAATDSGLDMLLSACESMPFIDTEQIYTLWNSHAAQELEAAFFMLLSAAAIHSRFSMETP